MLTRRVFPCLDCRDGRVVKGVQFAGLRDVGSPAELAEAYERQGADEIVILDVSATPEGRANQGETVRAVRAALSIPLTVGGGVRGIDDAQRLLEAGADKVSINTAAVRDASLVDALANFLFGRQRDVRHGRWPRACAPEPDIGRGRRLRAPQAVRERVRTGLHWQG